MPRNPPKTTPAKSPSAKPLKTTPPADGETLLRVVEAERQRIFRAQAIAQTAACLLHQSFVPDENEPDFGYVLDDVVCDMLEHAITGLGSVTS
jgi:hypothetical protein